MTIPEERTAQAIARTIDFDHLNSGQLVDLVEALEHAIEAMANYGGSDDHIHLIASMLAEATVSKMTRFRIDERERANQEGGAA